MGLISERPAMPYLKVIARSEKASDRYAFFVTICFVVRASAIVPSFIMNLWLWREYGNSLWLQRVIATGLPSKLQ